MQPELRQIYELLSTFLGEAKKGYEDGIEQYQFPCPCCIDKYGSAEKRKYNLEVNIGGKQAFHCWKCASEGDPMQGSIQKLIRLYGGDTLARDYRRIIKSLRESEMYKLNYKSRDFSIDTDNVITPELSLPESFKFLDPNEQPPKKVMAYLTERGVGWDIILKHKMGYTAFQEEEKKTSYRVIIPSYDAFGDLNYWTGRDYLGFPGRQKYYNPDVMRKDIIFNENKIQWDADITLVEGPFDHIVVPNSIPLLGKALNKDYKLYWELISGRFHGNQLNVFLDADAIATVKELYHFLNHGNLYNKVRYIPVSGDYDPSQIYQEFGKKGIIDHLRNARKLSPIDI